MGFSQDVGDIHVHKDLEDTHFVLFGEVSHRQEDNHAGAVSQTMDQREERSLSRGGTTRLEKVQNVGGIATNANLHGLVEGNQTSREMKRGIDSVLKSENFCTGRRSRYTRLSATLVEKGRPLEKE
uniref:Uncharacterized protein n=1 Tax=Chromera velia CCMP2878 TaxID=1169474 RepID=A0A0G4HMZ3_9ALVE|eukprot:Cvel_29338.t1-p1 / transcript=Cvel_29338.t1 / gene=Cvel_29338 / organism=Chromera_velia_CCMP2878 / gene_product=hypothetical protein / transcript_product=hypothetical protein / location=Cvel_scaffold3991:4501-4875(-) / protein_length=125 / sequence_SO=supercontig / SO=protein_coding / is_pseudo=false